MHCTKDQSRHSDSSFGLHLHHLLFWLSVVTFIGSSATLNSWDVLKQMQGEIGASGVCVSPWMNAGQVSNAS